MVAYFQYISFPVVSAYLGSQASFNEVPGILARDHHDPDGWLFARDLDPYSPHDQWYKRDFPYKILGRHIENEGLFKRVITEQHVKYKIAEFEQKTKQHNDRYKYQQSLLDHIKPEHGFSDAKLEQTAKSMADSKGPNLDAAKEVKEDTKKEAEELRAAGRGPEAERLLKASDDYFKSWGRYRALLDAFHKNHAEYKRTGNWPGKGGASGSRAGGSGKTEGQKDEVGTSPKHEGSGSKTEEVGTSSKPQGGVSKTEEGGSKTEEEASKGEEGTGTSGGQRRKKKGGRRRGGKKKS